jgi:cytochrome d ubiquinol oxidase subunit II
MHLYELPMLFVLIGLIFYVVLAGADFGAGFWQLIATFGPRGARAREHAHEAMAPVWEANHVWLIFVLTVTWTAYPGAFGAIASTLSAPLFIAAVGIVLRGAAYALRAATSSERERRPIDAVFSISSILTPFALGTMIGAIASRRVPAGGAVGDRLSSWLNPTSILVGVLAVATSAYLAAVFLAADAARHGDAELQREFRVRALIAGVIAGAVALAGLLVLRTDARPLYHELLDGEALAGVLVSLLAGVATLLLVWRERFEAARYSAAAAVAAVIASWAWAQSPTLLPGLSVQRAAAPHDTLVAVVIAVIAGGAILAPSLALLFGLVLRGRLDHGEGPSAQALASGSSPRTPSLLARLALAGLLVAVGLLTIAEGALAHGLGALALLGCVVCGFLAAMRTLLPEAEPEDPAGSPATGRSGR